ncbi:MAG: DNA polymerase III subunit delta [Fimbriimonadaceae bacterium]|nr:DNA polymerase III subunit delta [Chthonomonadaceae bacterium]MCO5296863.1 DNA polymerase III subunit delta [Fimbriimonadaceae bacterium]
MLLSGTEDGLRIRGLHALLRAAEPEEPLELEQFEGGQRSADEWLAAAGTVPFLSDRRAVVVRHLLRSGTAEEAMSDAHSRLAALPPTSLLVLVADEEGGDDRRNARLRASWEKAVRAANGYVEDFKVNPKSLRALLKKEVEARGKKISDRAIDTLLEMTGDSSSRAIEELDKAILFAGDEESVREADIQAVTIPSREWNVYKMVDAALAGRVGPAMHQLRVLVGSQAKAEGAAFQFVLPTLSRQLRLAWQARLCVDSGTSPSNAPDAVTRLFPAMPNLQKMAPWSQDQAMRFGRRLSLDQLREMLQVVSDADARLKGLLPGFSSMETLERMLLELVRAASR